MRPADSFTVLIVSDDAAAAALLGGLVETLGYAVQFSSARAAADRVRQTRPRIAMLDCTGDCDEASIARTLMRGVAVVLVGPARLLTEMRDVASRYGVEMVFTPPDPGPLGDVLDRAARRTNV